MLWAWSGGRPANLYKKKRDTVSEVGLFTIMCMAYGDWLNGLTRDKGKEHTALGWLYRQKPFLETFFHGTTCTKHSAHVVRSGPI